MLSAPAPEGITARVTFTNRLIPSGALLGNVGSALMSGASGRLWATNDGRGRIELQSDAGDVQIVWNQSAITVYDASSNTVYRAKLPARSDNGASSDHGAPALSAIDDLLSKLGAHATISEAQPDNVAGHEAYSVTLSPKHDGGLLASAQLAWDAARGVPLRIAIYAQGSSSPALALEATEVSYGPVAASDVDVSPPADAKVVDLGSGPTGGESSSGDKTAPVTGLQAVQAAAEFPVTAPDTLVGLPRQDVRLVGGQTVSSPTARASEASSSWSARETQGPRRAAHSPACPRCRSTESPRTSSRRSSERPSPGATAAPRSCWPVPSRPLPPRPRPGS